MKNIFVSSGIFSPGISLQEYRKIPKISPGAYIFQRPFLRGLFLEGLIFGGAYVRREICVSESIVLACSGKEICHFCFVLLWIWEQIPCTSPPGCLYSEGRFNGGFFMLRFWGAYTWRGLFSEFYGIFSSLQDIFSEITLKSQMVRPQTTETKGFTKAAWLKTQSALPSEWGMVILLDCKTVGFFSQNQ